MFGLNAKMLRKKERWAAEGARKPQTRATGRLPPRQRLVTDWPVLHIFDAPNLTPKDWSLTIGGMVAKHGRISYDVLCGLPQVTPVTDIHCVTKWSRYDNRWRGVATAELVRRLRPHARASHVILKGFDGYTANLALEDFAGPDCLLATHWEGAPIERMHGGPVRLVVPHLYFWKSPKWIRQIWFTDHDVPGFWETRGYHMRGDPWAEQRYGGPNGPVQDQRRVG